MIKVSKIKGNTVIFGVGAVGYGLIEILWRGYTHWSMLCAGGFSLLGLSAVAQKFKKCNIIIKALLGSGIITVIEFVFGTVFNLILKKNVWDYSRMPLNIKGQVCALYSFFWVILSMIFIPLAEKLNKKLMR